MYTNVAVIDDDYMVIDDLRDTINWEQNGFSLIWSAFNGKQALQFLRKQQPDILLVDLYLPDTDGISLSNIIIKTHPDISIIILSSFKDFEYAQQAIEIHAVSYLVKHQLTPEKLLQTLQAAREQKLQKKLNITLSNRMILRDVLDHGFALNQTVFPEHFPFVKPFLFLLFQGMTPLLFSGKEDIIHFSHFSGLLDSVSLSCKVMDIFIYQNHILAFFSPERETPFSQLAHDIPLLCRSVAKKLYSYTGRNFFLIYPDHLTVHSTLFTDYQLCVRHARDYIFDPAQTFFCVKEQEILPEFTPKKLSSELFYHENARFLKEARDTLLTFQERRDAAGYIQYASSLLQFFQTFSSCREYLPKLNAEYFSPQVTDLLTDLGYQCYQEYLSVSHYSPSTNFIISYIQKQYAGNPTLSESATLLNGNPMYLGQKFKKETSLTFHEYLTKCRIEKAKELLISENAKIYEVSMQVGISNSQYFSRIFKESTGLTPAEYRQLYQSR